MRSQKRVQQREERFRLLIDTLPVCISYTDKQETYQLNNKTYEEWFGLNREEITGRHVKEILGDAVYDASKSRIKAALAGEEQYFEAALPKLEGGVRQVLVNYVPEGNSRGQIEGFFTVVIDISERIEAEKSVQESERKFRRIFEHSNDAIFLLEPAGNIIADVNARACEMLGYTREELLSIGISAIHPNEMPELIEFTDSVFDQGHGWTNQLTCTTKAGQVLPAEMSASIVNIEGRDRMIAIIRDTTERRAAEMRIRQEAARAESLARIAARLNTQLSLDGVVNAVCEETVRALEAEAALLLLFDDNELKLAPAASYGMPSGFVEQYQPITLELFESSVDPQNPVIVLTDIRDSDDLPNNPLFERYAVQSIAAVRRL
jgi:PAS domain S-box-containing protein